MTEGRKRAVANGVKFGPKFKLNSFQKQEALARLAAGESQSVIAKTYGVDPATILRLQGKAARPRLDGLRARLQMMSTWNSFGPLKRLPSQTFTYRSSELDVPAVKVVCASWTSDTAKVVPAACTAPPTVKWPLAGSALLS